MLRFHVYQNNRADSGINLTGAYLVGSDGVPLAAEVNFRESQLICSKRAEGPAGVALLWLIPSCGTVMMETSRLMERETPYHLLLELTRGRLMRIHQKREDWGLFDLEGMEQLDALSGELDKARDLFVEAVKADALPQRSKLAEQALKSAFVIGEKLSQFHADLLLARRKQTHAFGRRTIGCTVDWANSADSYRQKLREGFDFLHLPIPWRALEPEPKEFNWPPFDAWIEWFAQNRMPVKIGPLVCLNKAYLPDWLSAYENNYEKIRGLIFEHVRRVIDRYNPYALQWDVLSGIHAENTFNFDFDQLMELTRTTVTLAKQLAPQAQILVDIIAPWGEYFARNQMTIPPIHYADMVVQSGVGFDALGVQFVFGAPQDGMYIRDMFQISEKLDRLGNFGKPVHVTAVQVPSSTKGTTAAMDGGHWWKAWSEAVQAKWLKEFYTLALSKPFVESVTWKDLADRPGLSTIASGGLLRADLQGKPAFKILQDFRSDLLSAARKPPAARTV